jgi:NAD(P)H-dependent flavin oxidoreductase YrpB (nitropropane dioxygenase family)
MIHTRICEILAIEHPIALGGMPSAFNNPELVAAVSSACASDPKRTLEASLADTHEQESDISS